MGKTNNLDPVITRNGAKVLECLYGDCIWEIEHCPLKSSNRCLALQKDIKHYYKAKFSKQTDCGIPTSCYVGYYSATHGLSIELHKFWFFHDDIMHCVGGTSTKYALNKLALPSLWLVHKRTYFIQIEVVALEVGFLLLEKPRCPFVNPIGNNISTHVN